MKENNNQMNESDLKLFDYLIYVLDEKKFIFKVTLTAMSVALIVALVLPPIYYAETRILPPQNANSSMASLMASQMSGIGIPIASLGVKTTNDLYVSLLKTKTVADFVIDKLDLMKVYGIKSRETMRKRLSSNLVVRDDRKSGIITVGFYHRNPEKSAEIANSYIEGLQNLNNSLAITEAGQRRLFFEAQLNLAKENLIRSEESLKSFQQRTGTIKIDDEAKAVIGTVTEMRAKVSAKEVQLRVMRTYATPENPDLQRLHDETVALKEELRKLESKNRIADDSLPNVEKMSSVGTEYVRRMRDFKYNETLYDILTKQFEAAKLDEAKDAALVQIIEKAERPEIRAKPKRRVLVVNVGLIFFVLSVLLVLSREYLNSFVNDSRNQDEIRRFKKSLDFDASFGSLKEFFYKTKRLVLRQKV